MSSAINSVKSKDFCINDFRRRKKNKIPISMITCYDYSFAQIINISDVDVVLVGDSLGNVFAGYSNTIPVSVDQMIYHTEIVRRGAPTKFLKKYANLFEASKNAIDEFNKKIKEQKFPEEKHVFRE